MATKIDDNSYNTDVVEPTTGDLKLIKIKSLSATMLDQAAINNSNWQKIDDAFGDTKKSLDSITEETKQKLDALIEKMGTVDDEQVEKFKTDLEEISNNIDTISQNVEHISNFNFESNYSEENNKWNDDSLFGAVSDYMIAGTMKLWDSSTGDYKTINVYAPNYINGNNLAF